MHGRKDAQVESGYQEIPGLKRIMPEIGSRKPKAAGSIGGQESKIAPKNNSEMKLPKGMNR
jgi:hypothetical protein